MSEAKKTLKELEDWAPAKYADAIREVLAEVERLRASLKAAIQRGGKLTVENERLRAKLAETEAYWEECQTEHHKLNVENERLRVEVGETMLVVETQDNQIERLREEVEGLKDQNQEIASSNADHVRWHRETKDKIDAALAAATMPSEAIAWAILCADGSVHEFEENCGLFLADDQARDECEILNDDPDDLLACGPHAVAALTLRGGDKVIAHEETCAALRGYSCDCGGNEE
jgi:regulator of replication initiation timing